VVLTSEIYAVAALVGAGVVAVGSVLGVSPAIIMPLGATLCAMPRMTAVRRRWKVPIPLSASRETAEAR
jgi:uncharacterized membrane protein YeiH